MSDVRVDSIHLFVYLFVPNGSVNVDSYEEEKLKSPNTTTSALNVVFYPQFLILHG